MKSGQPVGESRGRFGAMEAELRASWVVVRWQNIVVNGHDEGRPRLHNGGGAKTADTHGVKQTK
jgi:hypothetical protein